jgi:HSP20 family molecular chaperone IbpA
MARGDIEIRRTDSIRSEFERLHQAISERAYEMFRHRDWWSGGPLADWLNAEHELVWQPPIELRQKDDQLEVLAAVAGVDSKDLDVQVTAEDVLIKSEVDHHHAAESGTVHLCEFNRGKVFRSIHLPDKIDPETAKAEYRNGLLRLTASIAKPITTKIAVQAT